MQVYHMPTIQPTRDEPNGKNANLNLSMMQDACRCSLCEDLVGVIA